MIKFFTELKNVKFVLKKDKGVFQAYGLHHAAFAVLLIAIGYLFHVEDFMAVLVVGIYLRHEWGGTFKPPVVFEYMDFLAPATVVAAHFIVSRYL